MTNRFHLLIAAAVAALILTAPRVGMAGPGIWTSSGPNGGRTESIVASPSTPNTFYAGTRGGVFKSIDGGLSWNAVNAGITRQLNGLIVHSETAPNVLYTFGARKVFHSDDAAASWTDRSPPGALLPSDTGILAAAASKTAAGRLYVALANGELLRSDNSALTWSTVSPALPLAATDSVTTLATHPVNTGELLVSVDDRSGAGNDAVYRLTNAHLSGSAAAAVVPCPGGCPWENFELKDFEFFGNGGRVWATGFGGAARSDDFGATWTLTGGGDGNAISVHPSDSASAYVSGLTVSFTTDDGATWSTASSFVGSGSGLPARAEDVTYDPFNPAFQLAATSSNGVFRNVSSGSDVYTPQVTGFNASFIRALALGPANRLHAGVGDSFGPTFASFRSTTPSSITWGPAYTGLQADQLRALEVDPNATDTVYAGGRFFPQGDGAGGVVNGNGGIYKSTDGGATWTTIDNGIPFNATVNNFSWFGTVRSVEIDETSAGGATGASQKLLVGGSGAFRADDCSLASPTFTKESARIFVSIDAGVMWSPSDTGLGGAECSDAGFSIHASVVQIVQSTVNPSEYWAATFVGGLRDSDVPTAIENGVFKSTDGGTTWSHTSVGLPRINGLAGNTAANVLSLAFDPTDPTGNTLYASTNEGFLGTVYKTTDGGASWSFAGTGVENRDVRDLLVDPTSGNVYAAAADPESSGDGGVFVSEDGGVSWSSISTGFPASAIAVKLALDTTGINPVIHAGTLRGVQSFERLPDGDTDGAPTQTEDAAPGGGDGNSDGMADAQQPDVASPRVLIPGARGNEATVTTTLSGISGTCGQIENSVGLDLITGVPEEPAWEAPFNGLYLRVPDCEIAEITMIYAAGSFGDDPSYTVRGYGRIPGSDIYRWVEPDSVSVSGNTWTFTVTDDGPADATGDDGVIVFQGAAKRLREIFFADGMEPE